MFFAKREPIKVMNHFIYFQMSNRWRIYSDFFINKIEKRYLLDQYKQQLQRYVSD